MLFLFVLFFVFGCGSGGGSASSTPANSLVVSIQAEPPTLDPSISSALVDRQVMASLYDKLVDIDESGEIVPVLAESFEASDDGMSYTFKLRDGIEFHDGTPFDAEAVKFNLDRYRQEDSTRSTELGSVENVEVVDPRTVRVALNEPFSPFLAVLTDRAGMMVSPAAVEKSGEDYANNPVGTGPFKFVERVRGDHITVEKNPGYWQEGLPKVDEVVYRGIEDKNVQLQNLRSGQLDMIDQIPFNEVRTLEEGGDYKVINETGLGFQGFYLNLTRPPFDDPNLRRAVYEMADREAIVGAVLREVGGAAGNSPFGPDSFAHGESDEAEPPNVKEARAALEEAGMPDGFEFTMKLPATPDGQQLGRVIQQTMEPAGIKVNLEQLEFGALLEDRQAGDFEALQLGWSGRIDPDQNIYDFVVTDAGNNDSGYSNARVDELLNEARGMSDTGERKRLYDEAVSILHDEVPYVYLYHENNLYAMHPSVKGFEYHPDGILRLAGVSKSAE
ncbi:MAG: ABC transporter substrate-binding protein [Actinomycetota bacterium]|nr:ABC transporter substrate-binding protein [Actinomycetota bacterium]